MVGFKEWMLPVSKIILIGGEEVVSKISERHFWIHTLIEIDLN